MTTRQRLLDFVIVNDFNGVQQTIENSPEAEVEDIEALDEIVWEGFRTAIHMMNYQLFISMWKIYSPYADEFNIAELLQPIFNAHTPESRQALQDIEQSNILLEYRTTYLDILNWS